MDEYVIITVPGCPWCSKAIDLAEKEGFSYRIQGMTWGKELREIQAKQEGWKTVPMVFKVRDGVETFLGGYTEFQNYVNEVKEDHARQEENQEAQR